MKNTNPKPRWKSSPIWAGHLSITDRLALVRTDLANERTLLAYFRTFIGLFAAGVGLIRFIEDPLFVWIGVVMAVASPGVLVLGFLRFRRERRILHSAALADTTLDDGDEPVNPDAPDARNMPEHMDPGP